MPEPEASALARRDRREGKSPSTQAGEFVREEMHHIREGKHGARSTKQSHCHRIVQGAPCRRKTSATRPTAKASKPRPPNCRRKNGSCGGEDTNPRIPFSPNTPACHFAGITAEKPERERPAVRCRGKRGGAPGEKARPRVQPLREKAARTRHRAR